MFREDAAHDVLVEIHAEDIGNLLRDAHTAERGLRPFISTIAAMSATDGPFGPGLRRGDEAENRSRYFRSTKALWNFNNVAGCISAPHLRILRGLRNSVVNPRIRRSTVVRFGAMSGTIADQQLMFEQQRFRDEGAGATSAQQLRKGDKQVDGEDQKFAHERTLS